MRIAMVQVTVALTFSVLAIAHPNHAQEVLNREVSLTLSEVTLEKALMKIESTAHVRFGYSRSKLNLGLTVSVTASNRRLGDLLDSLLSPHKIQYSVQAEGDYIILTGKSSVDTTNEAFIMQQPSVAVTGKVTDSQGVGLPGVNVLVKGTTNGVTTNAGGEYTIDAIPGDVLLFSFIGYKAQEVKIEQQTILHVTLIEDVTTLQEVVVTTAYGVERKSKEIGYTVTKVAGTEVNKANSGSLLTGLVGKVAGLSITTQSSDMTPQMRILLRGVRSFGANTNNQPLFVFNGAPLSFGSDQTAASQALDFINNLNPADIEDVTILKGANGTALYGPEGVNGVIIITTKKAALGSPVINFANNTSIQIVDFRQDYRQRRFGLGSGLVDSEGNGIYDPMGSYSWGPAYDGSVVPIGYPDENGDLQYITYDYKKDSRKFFEAALTNRTNLSFSQADVSSSYYLGLGYVKQTGLLPDDRQNQLNVLLTTTKKIGNAVKIQTNFNYSRVDSDRGRNLEATIKSIPNFIPLLDYQDWQHGYWANHDRYYKGISPYEELANNRSKATTHSLNGNLTFDVTPVHWLTITERPSVNYTAAYIKTTGRAVRFADFVTDPQKLYDIGATTSELMISNTSVNNDFIVSTVHKAGDFLIRTNVGNTVRQNYIKEMRAGAQLAGNVFNLAFSVTPVQASESAILSRTTSAFGRVSAGYKDMIFAEVTGRNEWDSKRAKVARGKDFYASVNTSILLNQMVPVLKELKWLTSARLRASFAKSANMNITPYQSERILYLTDGYPYLNADQSNYVYGYGFLADNNPNPLLEPEKVFSQEYGLSLGFKNILTADFTYYYQLNNSVILNVANAWLSGFPTTDNAGKFENHGVELELTINPIKLGRDFSISAKVTGAINNNEVLSLTPVYNGMFPVDDPGGQKYFARPGHSAYEFGITDWRRDPQGRVVIDKNNGFPIQADYGEYQIGGNTLPRYSSSLSLTFNWRKFGMSALLDYVGGYNHMFSTSGGFFMGTDPRTTYNDRKPFVFPNSVYMDDNGNYVENTDIKVQSAGQDLYTRYSTRNIYGLSSGAFLKLRQVSFEYNQPIKSTSIKYLTATLYARDVFSVYPSSNVYGDPSLVRGPGYRDFITAGNNASGGNSDESVLPGTVLFGLSLSATF
ncbi:SusC/RagA family TonB-linked outer membrane protein [Parachryseolinea silvisoli]|uniref:SusC/RagA family TonB-linked outer membrane protein n=1 Tax=Parachryseolinea silvisoli TaxID=2873601 RepID=UPI002265AA5E|nr:SusC/RagA family TonB-linked outer membrane protein [Parachryseolinea silvisoli]MCD9017542.1 SusC/RagA family TonB-linked outer membrane protein [Parachryseolinea silvisoli]